ncbi:hypothetical protein ITX54_01285 [Rouxiella silvae]|uniref:Type VI secretion protein n=1 Tax=Rouxiella silvae TaxID=1646373 RepID=A0AA40WYQ2_9GAMM|nr:hypothetical protein [Rouxiella silvae]MBF6635304.1 hypothetical protein [Rouxiella silvae]
MAWQRQKLVTTGQPPSRLLGHWLLSLLLPVIIGIILFILHSSDSLSFVTSINIWIFSLLPILLWTVTFIVYSFLYGRKVEHCHFQEQQAEKSHQEWQAWSERYMAVLGSCVLLPDMITANFVEKKPPKLEMQYNLTRRINYLDKTLPPIHQAILVLLKSLSQQISALPDRQRLTVTLLTDVDARQHVILTSVFLKQWAKVFPKFQEPEKIDAVSSLSYNLIDKYLKQTTESVYLILILQLEGKQKYSDGLGIFLLAADDAVKKLAVPIEGRLLRPMPIDPTQLDIELSLFLETQDIALQASGLAGGSKALSALIPTILPVISDMAGAVRLENVQILEQYIGIPGPFSAWLTAGFVLDFVRIQNVHYLVFSQSDADWFVSTISPGCINENIQ